MDSAGVAVLVVGDVLNSLPHSPWIIISEMVFDFFLISLLGIFDASLQVGSSGAVKGLVT